MRIFCGRRSLHLHPLRLCIWTLFLWMNEYVRLWFQKKKKFPIWYLSLIFQLVKTEDGRGNRSEWKKGRAERVHEGSNNKNKKWGNFSISLILMYCLYIYICVCVCVCTHTHTHNHSHFLALLFVFRRTTSVWFWYWRERSKRDKEGGLRETERLEAQTAAGGGYGEAWSSTMSAMSFGSPRERKKAREWDRKRYRDRWYRERGVRLGSARSHRDGVGKSKSFRALGHGGEREREREIVIGSGLAWPIWWGSTQGLSPCSLLQAQSLSSLNPNIAHAGPWAIRLGLAFTQNPNRSSSKTIKPAYYS